MNWANIENINENAIEAFFCLEKEKKGNTLQDHVKENYILNQEKKYFNKVKYHLEQQKVVYFCVSKLLFLLAEAF